MPVIVFASPKGGAGKTTSALVLATQIARHSPVTVIDADPNRPIKNWAEGENTPAGFHVIADADEENILDYIEEATSKTPYVVVDLEGTASKIVLLAVSQADLVIIPMQPSQLDADQASRALRVVRQQEKMSRRVVPYGVLFTRTNNAVRSRTLRHITQTLTDSGIRVFRSELNEREAFRAMFAFSEPLEKLDPAEVSNVPKAIENAEWFAEEVAEMLREASTVGDANG
jgi:chromosome partitioning protein